MNSYPSTNSLVDAIGTVSCYTKNPSYETEPTTASLGDNFQLKRASFLICLCSMRGCHAYCTRLRRVTKVTNSISDFTFLSSTNE